MQDAPIAPHVLLEQIAGAIRMRAPKQLDVPTLLLASRCTPLCMTCGTPPPAQG
jgi:hypothetical protein